MHENHHDVASETMERAAEALYYYRFGDVAIFGRPRQWTSPLAFFHRALCRDDAAELARLDLLNPNPDTFHQGSAPARACPLKPLRSIARVVTTRALLLLIGDRAAMWVTKNDERGSHSASTASPEERHAWDPTAPGNVR